MLQNNPGNKKLIGGISHVKGDIKEKHVHDTMATYLRSTSDTVLMIQGCEIKFMLGDPESKQQEMDFLIINQTKKYILNVEVKTWLGPLEKDPSNPKKNSAIKVAEQMTNSKKIISK